MKHKVKTTVDNVERELEIDLDPKALGLFTKEDVTQGYTPKDAVEQVVKDRLAQFAKGHVKFDEIGTNAELKQKVLDLLGVKIAADGKPQLTADQITSLQGEWRKKELEPAAQRAEKAEKRVESLLDRILFADILAAAAEAKVHEGLLKPTAEGSVAPIVSMLGLTFDYSDEHERHFVRKGDGFDFSSDPKSTGAPYKGVREFVLDWASKKENAPFVVQPTKPGGPQLHRPGSTGGPVTIEAPQDRPLTLQEYQAAAKEAGEGGTVRVKGLEIPA